MVSESRKRSSLTLSQTWPGLRYFSLCALLTWMYLVMDFGAWMTASDYVNLSVIDVNMCMYIASAVVLFAAVPLQSQFQRLYEKHSAAVLIVAIATVGTLLLIFSGPSFRDYGFTRYAFRIGSIMCGIGAGLMVLRVGQLFCRLEPSKAFLYAIESEIAVAALFYLAVGTSWYSPFQEGPALSYLIAIVVAPSVCLLLAALPPNEASQEAAVIQEPVRIKALFTSFPMSAKLMLVIFVFSAAASIVCNCFMLNQTPSNHQLNAQQAMLLRLILVLALLFIAVRFSGRVPLGKLYLVSVVALVLVVAMLPLLGLQNQFLLTLTRTLFAIIDMLVWCLLAFVAKAGSFQASLVFGLGKGCSHAGLAIGYTLGYYNALANVQTDGNLSIPFALVLIALVIVSVVLVFTEKDFDAILEASGASALDVQEALAAGRRIEWQKKEDRPWQRACQAVGERAMLSSRELELLEELSRNRTPQDIASRLSITVATVRTHTNHIYTKLDVHSRDELIDLVRDEFEALGK